MEPFSKLLIGASGITGVELLQIVPTDPVSITEVIKTIVQIVIGVATLWAMFKKKKK